jgi:uncharacterized protein YkwD
MKRFGGLFLLLAASMLVPARHDAAGAPTPAVASSDREILEAHNAVRSRLGVPPLTWSNEMAAAARRWAKYLSEHQLFYHKPDAPYGENLFMIIGRLASGSEVVDRWAAEGSDYHPATNTCTGICGHYTQIVWRTTQRVGCAAAVRESRQVWVCDYDPPGNYIGLRPY